MQCWLKTDLFTQLWMTKSVHRLRSRHMGNSLPFSSNLWLIPKLLIWSNYPASCACLTPLCSDKLITEKRQTASFVWKRAWGLIRAKSLCAIITQITERSHSYFKFIPTCFISVQPLNANESLVLQNQCLSVCIFSTVPSACLCRIFFYD